MKRILIADDDSAICDAVSMILQAHGYIVDIETEMLSPTNVVQNPPDLILLDIWMSGMDGRDIAKQLKSHSSTEKIPIVMVSASRELAKSAHDAGANDFLEKPFMMNDLIAKIERNL